MELNDTWILFSHDKNKNKCYNDNMQILAEINTIQHFWQVWNNIPSVKNMFFDGKNFKLTGKRPIHSWSFFRKGIEPTWEHPKNSTGGEWNIRKFKSLDHLADLWLDIILLVLGENFDESESVTGIRVVDSSSYERATYRIEIWIDNLKVKPNVEAALKKNINISNRLNLIFKNHANSVEN